MVKRSFFTEPMNHSHFSSPSHNSLMNFDNLYKDRPMFLKLQ